MIRTSSTALHAIETASYYACLHTRRGYIARHAAPVRAFFKRVARRAERREGKRIDVEAAILDVSCDYCGRIDCSNVWCGEYDFWDDIDHDFVLHSPARGQFSDSFAAHADDFDDFDLEAEAKADLDARAWRDLYDDLDEH